MGVTEKLHGTVRAGIATVVVGAILFLIRLAPIPFFDDDFNNDLMDLAAHVIIVVGASVVIRELSRSIYMTWSMYAASVLLVLARILDFTEEIPSLDDVTIIGNLDSRHDPLQMVTEGIGYVFMLLVFVGVLYELAKARVRMQEEHDRYRELTEASMLLARTADMAVDAVIGVDRSDVIRAWSGGAERLFGYASADAREKRAQDLFSRGLPERDEPLVSSFQAGKLDPRIECTARKVSGETFLAEATLALVNDEAGAPVGLSLVVRDIEHVKQAEQELLASRNILSSALQSAEVGVFIVDMGGEIIEFNKRLEELTGVERGDVDDFWATASKLWDGESDVVDFIRDCVFNKGKVADFPVLHMQSATGKPRTIHLSVSPVRDYAGAVMGSAGICVDLTEREVLQQRLAQSQKMESIGRLAGGIAHDFNNILAAVLGYASLLVQTADGDSDVARYGEAIESSAKRASELTNQLLTFARGGPHQRALLSLADIVHETLALLKGGVKPNVRFEVHTDDDLYAIEGDSSQMHQVILNLGLNARDAIDEAGTVTIEIRNEHLGDATRRALGMRRNGPHVRLTVKDTGRGMSPEVLERAFEPFFSTKETGEGYGLGMSVVYGIVEAHEGALEAASERGKGTTVDVYLPAVADAAPAHQAQAPEGRIDSELPEAATLLVVDDEALIRTLVTDVFRSRRYSVLEADSGEAAIEILEANQSAVDLIILDLVMPGMGGLDALKKMQERAPETPIIISSGYGGEHFDPAHFNGHNVRFVQKPYKASVLIEQARELLRASAGRI